MHDDDFQALIAGLEHRGFTRTEIAVAAGLSRDTIWRLATGTARRPSYQTIMRLERTARRFSQFDIPDRHIGQEQR